MNAMNITVRPLEESDRARIEELLKRVDEFRSDEVACALELVEAALTSGNSDDEYAIFCAEDSHGRVVGFLCYSKTPLTQSVYDLYWIASDPRYRCGGIGRALLCHLEHILEAQGGSILVTETSSLPAFEKARAFYTRQGFREECRIRDFYAPGDDRITYCKRLPVGRSGCAADPLN